MKTLLSLLVFLNLFWACERMPKTPSQEELLKRELKNINWQQVDEYPSVLGCDSLGTAAQRRDCFFSFISANLQEKLNEEPLLNIYPALDTIKVTVTVYPDSSLGFEPQFQGLLTAADSTHFDSILASKAMDLPKINPAIKQGMPVKCQFVLPIVIARQ